MAMSPANEETINFRVQPTTDVASLNKTVQVITQKLSELEAAGKKKADGSINLTTKEGQAYKRLNAELSATENQLKLITSQAKIMGVALTAKLGETLTLTQRLTGATQGMSKAQGALLKQQERLAEREEARERALSSGFNQFMNRAKNIQNTYTAEIAKVKELEQAQLAAIKRVNQEEASRQSLKAQKEQNTADVIKQINKEEEARQSLNKQRAEALADLSAKEAAELNKRAKQQEALLKESERLQATKNRKIEDLEHRLTLETRSIMQKSLQDQIAILKQGTIATDKELKARLRLMEQAQGKAVEAQKRYEKSAMGALGESGTTFGHKLATTAQYATAGAILYTLAAGLRAAMVATVEFDTATRTMSAVLDISMDKATRLGESVAELGQTYGGTLESIYAVTNALGRAGIAVKDLTAATEVVIKMALLTGDTFEQSTKAIISYQQVFGNLYGIEEIGDKLAYVANASRLSTEDIGTFSNYALSASQSVGITIDALGALAISFSNVGVNASTIGTQIRTLSTLFVENTTDANEFFRSIGINQKTLLMDLQKGGDASNKAFLKFTKILKNLTDTEFSTYTRNMDQLVRDALAKIRLTADSVEMHLEGSMTKANGALDQAKVIAEGYKATWESVQNIALESLRPINQAILTGLQGWLLRFQVTANVLGGGSGADQIRIENAYKILHLTQQLTSEYDTLTELDKVRINNEIKMLHEQTKWVTVAEKERKEQEQFAQLLKQRVEYTERLRLLPKESQEYKLLAEAIKNVNEEMSMLTSEGAIAKRKALLEREMDAIQDAAQKRIIDAQKQLTHAERERKRIEQSATPGKRKDLLLSSSDNELKARRQTLEDAKAAAVESEAQIAKMQKELEGLGKTAAKVVASTGSAMIELPDLAPYVESMKALLKLEGENAERQKGLVDLYEKKLEASKQTLLKAEYLLPIDEARAKDLSNLQNIQQLINDNLAEQATYAGKSDESSKRRVADLEKINEQLEVMRKDAATYLGYQEALFQVQSKRIDLAKSEGLNAASANDYAQNILDASKERLDVLDDTKAKYESLEDIEARTIALQKLDSEILAERRKAVADQWAMQNQINSAIAQESVLYSQLLDKQEELTRSAEFINMSPEQQKAIQVLQGLDDKGIEFQVKLEGLEQLEQIVSSFDSMTQSIISASGAMNDFSKAAILGSTGLAESFKLAKGLEETAAERHRIEGSLALLKKEQVVLTQQYAKEVEAVEDTSETELKLAKNKTKIQQTNLKITELNTQEYMLMGDAMANMLGAAAGLMEQGSAEQKALLIAQQAVATTTAVAFILQSGVYGSFAGIAAAMTVATGLLAAAGIAFSGSSNPSNTMSTIEHPDKTTVLGGGDKQSKSIVNALEVLEEYAKPEFDVLSQMAYHLRNIDNNMAGATRDILRNAGFALGVGAKEGQTYYGGIFDKGFFGSEVGGKALSASAIVGGANLMALSPMLGATNILLGALGVGDVIGKGVDKVLSTLGLGGGGYNWQMLAGSGIGFGTSEAEAGKTYGAIEGRYGSVKGSQKAFNAQTLADLIDNFEGLMFQSMSYESMSKDWKGSASYAYFSRTTYQEVDDQLAKTFQTIFGSMRDTIVLASETLGKDVLDQLNQLPVTIGSINLKGLKGEEITEKLEEAFSTQSDKFVEELFTTVIEADNTAILDQIAQLQSTKSLTGGILGLLVNAPINKQIKNLQAQMAPDTYIKDYLFEFQGVGEGMYETLIRVSSGIETASYYADRLGSIFEHINYYDIENTNADVSFEALYESIRRADGAAYGFNNGVLEMLRVLDGTAAELYDTYLALDGIRGMLTAVNKNAADLSSQMFRGAGSIDAFYSSLSTYIENFLTDEEQFAYQQSVLAKEFERLNIAAPQSAEAFRAILEGVDTSTAEGQELYGRLIVLSKQAAEVFENNPIFESLDTFRSSLLDLATKAKNAAESLRGSYPGEVTLDKFYSAMGRLMQSINTGNLDYLGYSLDKAIEYSSVLKNTKFFETAADMRFAQLVAANQFDMVGDALLTEVDYLASIADNTELIAQEITKLSLISAIPKMPGYSSGGYTGNMGVGSIAGVVHGQEYVVNAQTTRDLGLNANNGGVFKEMLIEIKALKQENADMKQLMVRLVSDTQRSLQTQRATLDTLSA